MCIRDRYRIAVIAGDVIAEMDASRFRKLGVPTIPVNTGKECHLDAKLLEKALNEIDLENTDILIIENVGNLICPVDFKLGEHLRIVIVSAVSYTHLDVYKRQACTPAATAAAPTATLAIVPTFSPRSTPFPSDSTYRGLEESGQPGSTQALQGPAWVHTLNELFHLRIAQSP